MSCLNSSPAKPQQRISSSLPAHSGVKQDWEGKGKKIKESELILLSNLLGGKVIRMFLHLGKFSNLQINYETQITWVSLPPSHPTLPVIPIIYSAARVTILVAEIWSCLCFSRLDGSSPSTTRPNPHIFIGHIWPFLIASGCISSPHHSLHLVAFPAIPKCFSQWHCPLTSICMFSHIQFILFPLIVSCLYHSDSLCFLFLFCLSVCFFLSLLAKDHQLFKI